jgi:hypothetical protein
MKRWWYGELRIWIDGETDKALNERDIRRREAKK